MLKLSHLSILVVNNEKITSDPPSFPSFEFNLNTPPNAFERDYAVLRPIPTPWFSFINWLFPAFAKVKVSCFYFSNIDVLNPEPQSLIFVIIEPFRSPNFK